METPECPGCRILLARVREFEAWLLVLQTKLRNLLDKLRPPTPQPPKPLAPGPVKKATGKKPDEQPGGAGAVPGVAGASPLVLLPQRGGLPLRGTVIDGGRDAEVAETKRAGLSGTSHHRPPTPTNLPATPRHRKVNGYHFQFELE